MGIFDGNNLERVFIGYEIQSVTHESLKDTFEVKSQFSDSHNVILQIDLRKYG